MQIININNSYHYETENLLRVFFPEEKFHCAEGAEEGEDYCIFETEGSNIKIELSLSGELLSDEKAFSFAFDFSYFYRIMWHKIWYFILSRKINKSKLQN